MKIYSYVVVRDFGFAPNPFHGYCTLATCKPEIRQRANVGDLIVGTNASPNSYNVVYLMFVTETMTFDQYWNDSRFSPKQPDLYSSVRNAFGDNIYHRDTTGSWIQEDSHHTFEDGRPCEKNITTDTKFDRVLVSNDFCYWGREAVRLPSNLEPLARNGRGYRSKFDDAFKNQILQWAQQQPRGVIGTPIRW